MTLPYQILAMYVVWFATVFYVYRLCKKSAHGSVGIPLSYLLTMTFMHCGGLAYAMPDYTHMRMGGHLYLEILNFTEEMVRDGVLASAISVVGMALGCYLCRDKKLMPAMANRRPVQGPQGPLPPRRPALRVPPISLRQARLPLLLLAGGAAAFILTRLNLTLPSLQSIIAAARNLAVVAICLGLWMAYQRRDRDNLRLWAAMTVVVPVTYLLGFGFFSYGFMAIAVVTGFWLSVPRPGKKTNELLQICLVLAGIYVSLSIFVTYMEVRNSLRDVLWDSDARLSERISIVVTELAKARPFNPFDFRQLDWVNIRLNQNMLIGKAMWLHEIAPYLRENGLAFLGSLFAWVPRFLWPSKPGMGGNDFVGKHTDMSFSDGTTIGAGPVFELFVNFGLIGVFLGSIVFGWILRWMDVYCARQLHRRDIGRFIRGYLVSVCLINPMSLIFFLVSSATASWIIGSGIIFVLDRTQKRDRRLRPPAQGGPETEKQIWVS